MEHDRIDIHVYLHTEPSGRVTEKLDSILHAVTTLATQEQAHTKMVSEQIRAFSDRVNAATNEIASDLQKLRDKVATGQPLSAEDAEVLNAAATRLEAMGVDPEDPTSAPAV